MNIIVRIAGGGWIQDICRHLMQQDAGQAGERHAQAG